MYFLYKNSGFIFTYLVGLACYFRKFVSKFSQVMKPLCTLTSGNKNITWTDTYEKIRQKVISVLTDAPVLMIFSPNYPIELHTDASSDRHGAILMHKVEGKNRVVECYSKRTSPTESRYHSYELETLAVLNAIRHFATIYIFFYLLIYIHNLSNLDIW